MENGNSGISMLDGKDSSPSICDITAEVGIIRCDTYEEVCLERKLIEGFGLFGGVEKYVRSGDTVFVKPNLIRAPRTPGDPPITDPALLYSLCKIIKDLGAKPVLGDSPAFGTIQKILRKCGYEERLKKLGVKLVQLRRCAKVKRVVAGEERTFVISKDVVDSDFLINVPKVKVHSQLVMTLAMKNIFGCVPGKRKAWRHMSYGDKNDGFARMIAETLAAVSPDFTILDAIVAMEGHGPTGGNPVKVGLLFFGEDCLAIERVVAEVLGVDPNVLPVYRAATEIGVGESRLGKIGILGDTLEGIGHRRLVLSDEAPVRFSILRVMKSTMKNIWISRFKKEK